MPKDKPNTDTKKTPRRKPKTPKPRDEKAPTHRRKPTQPDDTKMVPMGVRG